MSKQQIHHCQCQICQQEKSDQKKEIHSQMNLLLSRLNEQQRRWYVALEAKKMGHGGVKQMSIITGMNPDTIKRGRLELEESLSTRPVARVRVAGGGRLKVEKKIQK